VDVASVLTARERPSPRGQVSLLHLAEITEEGVKFQSPMDGSEMLLTPEMSMALQNQVRSRPITRLGHLCLTRSEPRLCLH
jgi:tRNA-guanine family transglycosylase